MLPARISDLVAVEAVTDGWLDAGSIDRPLRPPRLRPATVRSQPARSAGAARATPKRGPKLVGHAQAATLSGHSLITNTVRYSAMSPEPFKDLWKYEVSPLCNRSGQTLGR